jgi:hypothetical protein
VAVLVFVGTVWGLWYWLPPRPDCTVTLPHESIYGGFFQFSPDGCYVLVPTQNGETGHNHLRMMDAATGYTVNDWDLGEASLNYVAWLDQGKVLVAVEDKANNFQRLCLWPYLAPRDPVQKSAVMVLHQQNERCDYQIAPDGKYVAISACVQEEGYSLMLLEMATGRILHQWRDPNAGRPMVLFSPKGRFLAVAWDKLLDGCKLMLYDLERHTVTLELPRGCLMCLEAFYAFSPREDILAMVVPDSVIDGDEYKIQLWDTQTGTLRRTIAASESIGLRGRTSKDTYVGSIHFLSSSYVALTTKAPQRRRHGNLWRAWGGRTWPYEANVHLFDVNSGQLVISFPDSAEPLTSPDGRFLAMQHQQGPCSAVKVRDLHTGSEHCWILTKEQALESPSFLRLNNGHRMLFFHGKQPEHIPAWEEKLRAWLGWKKELLMEFDLFLVDPATGGRGEAWSITSRCLQVIVASQNARLLLRHIHVGDHEDLEFYSLPLRRPWLAILGWALVVGLSVELLGRSRWLWRRYRTGRDSSESPQVPLV